MRSWLVFKRMVPKVFEVKVSSVTKRFSSSSKNHATKGQDRPMPSKEKPISSPVLGLGYTLGSLQRRE